MNTAEGQVIHLQKPRSASLKGKIIPLEIISEIVVCVCVCVIWPKVDSLPIPGHLEVLFLFLLTLQQSTHANDLMLRI